MFFRYDGPNAISVLSDFDAYQINPLSIASTADGVYVTTGHDLLHIALDGAQTVEAGLNEGAQTLELYQLLSLPDGLYGLSWNGGANQSGFVFRFVPEQGFTVLHDFSMDYNSRNRCLVVGNDNLIYGVAAFPEGINPSISTSLRASSTLMRIAAVAAKPQPKPRTFRFREVADQSANFVPVAKPDNAWLPASPFANKTRSVTVDVLANDRDPDKNPLTITGVVPPEIGYAQLVSTAGKVRVQFVTSEWTP